VLAAPRFWDGLPRFAVAVARVAGRPVELAVPASELAGRLPAEGWPGVTPVAVAFGNPPSLGFRPRRCTTISRRSTRSTRAGCRTAPRSSWRRAACRRRARPGRRSPP